MNSTWNVGYLEAHKIRQAVSIRQTRTPTGSEVVRGVGVLNCGILERDARESDEAEATESEILDRV